MKIFNIITRIKGFINEALASNKNLLLLALSLLLLLLVIQTLQLALIFKVLTQFQDVSMSSFFFDNGIRESINSFLKNYDLKLEDLKRPQEEPSPGILSPIRRLKSLFSWLPPLDIYGKTLIGVVVLAIIEIFVPDTLMRGVNGLYTVSRYVSDPVYYSLGGLFGVIAYVPKASYRLSLAGFKACREIVQSPFQRTLDEAPIVEAAQSRSIFWSTDSPEVHGRLPSPIAALSERVPTPEVHGRLPSPIGALSERVPTPPVVENLRPSPTFDIVPVEDVNALAQGLKKVLTSSAAAKEVVEKVVEEAAGVFGDN
jgi:hypothetical protein